MMVFSDPERMPAHAPAGLASARVVSPRTLDEACRHIADAAAAKDAAILLAGGTDVIVDRHLLPVERAARVDVVVDLTAIEGFHGVARTGPPGDERLVLGGGVTYWDLRTHPTIIDAAPMLGQMAKDVGAVQIQTRGTLAGNVASASPAADGVAALMALEATVHLRSAAGARTVPLEGFFIGYRRTVLRPDEIISAIELRVPTPGARVAWRKVGTRSAQAISKVALASALEIDAGVVQRARFGMASVASTTHPLFAVRSYIEGRAVAQIDPAELDAALSRDVQPIDDVRSTGEYRLHVARALVRRAVLG